MKSAIVTGATGFIGSWLVEELLANDYEVTVIVRDERKLLPSISNNSNCFVVNKAIENITAEDFPMRNYDVVYHLAWNGVDSKHKNDLFMQLDNIGMSIKILDVCNQVGGKLFIAAGTVAEYVFCEDIMDLNKRQTPNDYYGAAKVAVHHFLEVRSRKLDQDFIWAVIPSTFGERRTDSNIVTYTIRALLEGQKPSYGHLEQLWDFLYVSEVVRALRLIGEKGKKGKVYGIGSGQYKVLKDYIITIRNLIDKELPLGIGENKSMSEQTFSSCVNTYDLIKDTGFIPKVSFEEGIKKTIDYWKKRNQHSVSV